MGAVELLSAIFGRNEKAADAVTQLDKLSLNYAGLPVVRALGAVTRQIASRETLWLPEVQSILLNSRTVGPEGSFEDLQSHGTALEFWTVAAAGKESTTTPSIMAFAEAVWLLSVDQPKEAIGKLEALIEHNKSKPLKALSQLLRLTALSRAGSRCELIRAVSELGVNEFNRKFLPVSFLIGGFGWDEFRACGIDLSVCNALHILWQETGDSETASWLRFATSQVLKTRGRPSEMSADECGVSILEFSYFLEHVCVPGIMDVSRIFKSSREVLEERRETLGVLLELDDRDREAIQQQILTITNHLTLEDGLEVVDRSRIYVDSDAFRNWSIISVEEDFQRYLDLVNAGVGVSRNFDEVMRLLTTDINNIKSIFFTPDNQADSILFDMLMKLRDGFLNNTTFGFDYYLSKRIRHQSFVGLVRGPLEFANLITTRETENSDYKPNYELLKDLGSLIPQELESLSARLSHFSQQFDDALATLRDARLQIRSADRPDGIFEVPLTSRVLVVARSIAQEDESVQAFAETALAVFWGAIESSLAEARRLIGNDTKNIIVALLDQLRIDLREVAGRDPQFVKLDTALGRVSLEVQRNLDRAADWFVRADSATLARHFTISESVEIAIESAMKSQRSFEANINWTVEGEISVPATGLVLITEVIFVALDNVRRHSGLTTVPNIDIRCLADSKAEVLEIEVLSDASEKANGAEEAKRLQEIASWIDRGVFEKRTRREGGSGFLKLAAVARQSSKGAMEFGFQDDGRFRLLVRYSLIVSKADT